jgi:hypothetical protein
MVVQSQVKGLTLECLIDTDHVLFEVPEVTERYNRLIGHDIPVNSHKLLKLSRDS